MITCKSKAVLAGTAALTLIAIISWLSRPSVPDPMHAGRRVSAWYGDLCTGVFIGPRRASGWDASYAAFTNMQPDAVPYLTHQLRYDRSGLRQRVVAFLSRHALTKPLAKRIIWPLERRNYAAVALRQMGPKAESAIPDLMEAWANDGSEMKPNAVSALESIMLGHTTDGSSQAQWQALESSVIAEAARRYPKVAEELGIAAASVK